MKIGDRVRVLPGATYVGGEVDELSDFEGWDGVITRGPDQDGDLEVNFGDDIRPVISPKFLKPVEPPAVFYVNDKTYDIVDNPVSPSHYSKGMPDGVEVIDIIRAQGADYLHGNLIKYVLRWKYKGGIVDLKKGRKYIDWLIEQEENDGK